MDPWNPCGMCQEYSADAEAVEWYCPICGMPMPACAMAGPCALNDACCGDCFARCQAVERCALIKDDAFWTKLEAELAKVGNWRPASMVPNLHPNAS